MTLFCTPQQATVLTEAILNMLWTDMRPLSMVEGAGFKAVIYICNLAYTLLLWARFMELIERKYKELFQRMRNVIKATNSKTLSQLMCGQV